MAIATDQAPNDVEPNHHDDHHPSDWEYIKIALILGVLTAIEVGMFFLEGRAPNWLLYVGLSVLMVIKFVMVIAYFMHLKYDTNWFTWMFLSGLVLALAVYAIVFFAYDLFGLGGGGPGDVLGGTGIEK